MLLENIRRRVADAARRMHALGLVTLTGGNVSARDPDTRLIAITPSALPYETMTAGDIVVCDLSGNIVAGDRRPSTEWPLHSRILRERPDIGGVMHTHSPYALALAVAGRPVPPVCLEVVQCGGSIEVAPWGDPGTSALGEAALRALTGTRQAALLQNHGLLAVGATVEEALATAVRAEAAARTYVLATLIGKPVVLNEEQIAAISGYQQTVGPPPPGPGATASPGDPAERRGQSQ